MLKIIQPLSSDEVSNNPVPRLPVVIKIYEMIVGNNVGAAQNGGEITTP